MGFMTKNKNYDKIYIESSENMGSKKNKKNRSIWVSILILLFAVIYTLYENEINETLAKFEYGDTDYVSGNVNGNLVVSFLDVGEADSIFINCDDNNMIIDGGNNADGDLIVNYLKDMGVSKIKYVVGTHPHEDHIGGLDEIIYNFDIGKIFIPDVITTTRTFEDLLDAIGNKDMTYTVPKIGSKYNLGKCKIKVLYTGTDNEDLNMSSIVIRLDYYNTSFLFMGDAPKAIENKIMKKDIDVDVLKVGHHGSNTSSGYEFLNKVNPKYAVISVGKNNSYNLPGKYTLNNLKKLGIGTYRTDELGTIIITSDGNKLNINSKKTNTNGG